jgi:hypothetical protein
MLAGFLLATLIVALGSLPVGLVVLGGALHCAFRLNAA